MNTSSNNNIDIHRQTRTPYVSAGSARQLPVFGGDHAAAVHTSSLELAKPAAHAVAVNVNVNANGDGYANGAQGPYTNLATPTQQPKYVRVGMLFGFHAMNMCLGALAWVPAVLLTLVSIPLWCMSTSEEDGSEGGCFARLARLLADVDIKLANYAAPFVLKQREPIYRSPRLDAGVGPAVAKVFVYFASVKLLTALFSFIAVYGTVGTVVVAIASGGNSTGLPGSDTTFSDNAGKYLLLLLLRIIIGCFSVLRSAPRSLKVTRFFCGMRMEEQQQVDGVAGYAV